MGLSDEFCVDMIDLLGAHPLGERGILWITLYDLWITS